ncbi:hypothetical protein JL722_202 [Aureococcus anophagefferens]|nr:hypothetical protein JL722_202 [Aureococcus anophagefferens]
MLLARSIRRSSLASARYASTLVVADCDATGVTAATLSAMTASGALGPSASVLVYGASGDAAAAAGTMSGADAVFHFEGTPSAKSVAAFVKDKGFTHVVAPVGNKMKDFVPRVAAALGVSPVTEVVEVLGEDAFVRPMYAGNALATVRAGGDVKVLTVHATAFDKCDAGGSAAVEPAALADAGDEAAAFVSASSGGGDRPDLTAARVVIAGGRGMKSGENFGMLETLADKLGGAVGASRAAVDAGMVPNELQVGQTGKVVAPELYVAVGISGAIQHLSGMKDSKTIVAINKDAEAPIFQVADYGLVEDLFKAVPELEEKVAQAAQPRSSRGRGERPAPRPPPISESDMKTSSTGPAAGSNRWAKNPFARSISSTAINRKRLQKKKKANTAPAAPAARWVPRRDESSPTFVQIASWFFLFAFLVDTAVRTYAPAAAPEPEPEKKSLPMLAIAAGAVAIPLAAPHVGTALAMGAAAVSKIVPAAPAAASFAKALVPAAAPVVAASRVAPVAIILKVWRALRGVVGFAAVA